MSTQPSTPQFRIPAPQSAAADLIVHARPSRATYLRRRLLVVLSVITLAFVLVLTSNAISAEAGGATPATAGHVVVQPGQTLWEIAAEHATPGNDLRGYVLAIEQLNGVRADRIAAWDVLLLPVIR